MGVERCGQGKQGKQAIRERWVFGAMVEAIRDREIDIVMENLIMVLVRLVRILC